MTDDPYLSLTRTERAELIDEVSRRRNLAPAILEKDYWVCRTLDAIFSLPDIGEHLVFKGGTSLSKVFGLIERFSEDVDLSFHRDYLGFGDHDHDPEAAASNKNQRKRIDDLQAACVEHIREVLLPALQAKFQNLLGDDGWSLEVDPQESQTLLFHFPQAGAASLSYIKPAVRIELGARSDHWPRESHSILSYLGETLDQPLLGKATIEVLAAERTFWEKATILHAECHRPAEKPMPTRYARHYHDLARIAASDVADRALADTELRKRVVEHKSIYFRSASANYDLAVPGSFRLIPDASRLAELQKDHDSMAQMFFTPPPPLSEILETLRVLETKINETAP